MPKRENKTVKKRVVSILLGTTAFVLSILLYGQIAFGWFSSSKNVLSGGMGAQAQAFKALEIRAETNGKNIGVESVVADMDVIKNVEISDDTVASDGTKYIFPGVSGSFTFYVHDGSADGQAPYSFDYKISVKNNKFNAKSQNEGFYKNVDDESKATSLQYASSHILFFKNKTDGVYSGWIHPDGYENKSVSGGQTPAPCGVKIYWVWVERYEDVFQPNSGLIDEATRSEIAAYYLDEQNTGKIMVRGEKSVEAFNEADTFIGITLQYIFFEIEVSER